VDLLGKRPEELDQVQLTQAILAPVILVRLTQSDETTVGRIRNPKRGRIGPIEILVISLSINLRPIRPINRALNNPRFQIDRLHCVVSRADPHFPEIPADPLAWLVI
jgi:hypothetical protein